MRADEFWDQSPTAPSLSSTTPKRETLVSRRSCPVAFSRFCSCFFPGKADRFRRETGDGASRRYTFINRDTRRRRARRHERYLSRLSPVRSARYAWPLCPGHVRDRGAKLNPGIAIARQTATLYPRFFRDESAPFVLRRFGENLAALQAAISDEHADSRSRKAVSTVIDRDHVLGLMARAAHGVALYASTPLRIDQGGSFRSERPSGGTSLSPRKRAVSFANRVVQFEV